MTYTCIGYGHLATAVVTGLTESGAVPARDFLIYDKDGSARERAVADGHRVASALQDAVKEADILFLAVKPAVFRTLAEEVVAALPAHCRIVSPMAMFPLSELCSVFARHPVMRIMPSLAASLCHDVVGVCPMSEDFDDVIAALSKIGTVLRVDEEKLDKITVIASCGLGFSALILDAYLTSARKMGFTDAEALSITAAVFANAAAMPPYGRLADQVATKGGATAEGLAVLREGGFYDLLQQAVDAAYRKATGK